MRYFFLLLLISFPLLAMASYEDEQKICAHLLPKACNIALAKYWWGEKFDEIDSQIQEFKEAMQEAVLSDDYSEIEKYASFPFNFYVEDGRDNKTFLRRDNRSYTWVAYNIKDFGYWFRKSKKDAEILKEELENWPYHIFYVNKNYVELTSGYHHVSLIVTCKKAEKISFYVLPQNLKLCQNTSVTIQNIDFSF